MVSVVAFCVANSEVVDNETENNIAGVMFPQPRCEGAGCVPVWFHKCNELIVGNATGLWESVHAESNFNVDVPFMKWWALVLFDDRLREHPNGDTHVLVVGHGRA